MSKNREIVLLVFGRVFSVAFSLLSVKALTNFLPSAQVGQYYLINSIILYCFWVFINPVGTYYNRHYHQWSKEKCLKASFCALNKYFALCALLVFPVLYFLNSLTFISTEMPVFLLSLIVAAHCYFSSWFYTLGPTLNLLNKRKESVYYTSLAQLLGIISAIFLVVYFNATSFFWLWGILLGQVLSSLFCLRVFAKEFFEPSTHNQIFFKREMFSFSLPIMISTIFIWFLSQGYRLVVEKSIGLEGVAYFGIAFALAGGAAAAVSGLIGQYLDPNFYSGISTESQVERKSSWEFLWKHSVSLYLPIMFYVAALGPFWLKFLTSPAYHSAVDIFKWAVMVELLRMISNLISLIAQSEKNTKKSIFPYFIGAVTLGLGLYFIREQSSTDYYRSLAAVLFFSYFVCSVFLFFSMKKLMKVDIGFRFLFKKFLFCVPFLLVVLLNNTLGELVLWCYLFLTLYLFILIKFEYKKL